MKTHNFSVWIWLVDGEKREYSASVTIPDSATALEVASARSQAALKVMAEVVRFSVLDLANVLDEPRPWLARSVRSTMRGSHGRWL
jgi:hypothetical protein